MSVLLIGTFGKNNYMSKKKILILGGTGMAGHMLYFYLRDLGKYNIKNVCYRNKLTSDSFLVDIKDCAKVEDLIFKESPDYIINCIGILIKGSADIENAVFVNAYFPHFLRNIADKVESKLIHISTDCVFSGKSGKYHETSFKDADDVYGRSKALGEVLDKNHVTFRTSIIGPELKIVGEGLFHWFMNQTGTITGYTNAIWGGVTTLELAKAIAYYINNDTITGVVHLTNGIEISKYNLLNLFKSIWEIDKVDILKGEGTKTVNKGLLKSEKFLYEVPTYELMLAEMFDWMNNNRELYSQYKF